MVQPNCKQIYEQLFEEIEDLKPSIVKFDTKKSKKNALGLWNALREIDNTVRDLKSVIPKRLLEGKENQLDYDPNSRQNNSVVTDMGLDGLLSNRRGENDNQKDKRILELQKEVIGLKMELNSKERMSAVVSRHTNPNQCKPLSKSTIFNLKRSYLFVQHQH